MCGRLFRVDALVHPGRPLVMPQLRLHPPRPRIAAAGSRPGLALRDPAMLELVQGQVFGLAFDSNDNLFVADYSAGKIYKIGTNGVPMTFATGLSAPCAVAFPVVSPSTTPPPLVVSVAGSHQVMVSWQHTGSFTLQQNTNLANSLGWSVSSGVVLNNGTNSFTVTNPTGNLFFRLTR